jgi:hypothetical protein
MKSELGVLRPDQQKNDETDATYFISIMGYSLFWQIRTNWPAPESVVLLQLVYINASTADTFFPGFMEVIFSDISPKEAVDRVIEKLQQ